LGQVADSNHVEIKVPSAERVPQPDGKINLSQPNVSADSAFVEQAEYLDGELFSQWLVHHPNEEEILRKLRASGAKLLTGPRGTGKTTLMLKAKNQMLKSGSEPRRLLRRLFCVSQSTMA
jgi:hypothetical protein